MTGELAVNVRFQFCAPVPIIAGFLQAIYDELGGCLFSDVDCIDGQTAMAYSGSQSPPSPSAPWRRGFAIAGDTRVQFNV
jgi:hypothetical protein